MSVSKMKFRRSLAAQMQWFATAMVFAMAILLGVATLGGTLGYLPLLVVPIQFGDTIIPQGGLIIQGALSVLLFALVACLPSGMRVLALERSHRDFSITMSDVADAYRVCHAADRSDVFTLSEQFDAVKERIAYLRAHPDLGHLEPGVLEAASEMSFASRDLAATYSDENVARARGFLAHREEEIALFENRFKRASEICRDLKRQCDVVGLEEAKMSDRLRQLEDEFGDLLAELGFQRDRDNVVALPAQAPKGVAAE